jgi:two-component system response regulator FixJ
VLGSTVTIVDDDAAFRGSLEALLGAVGYATDSYSSGVEFLDTYNNQGNACVLLDARMPKMDGLQVLQALQSFRPSPPVVMITGNGELATAVQAMQLGAIGFLEKPFHEAELIENVEYALSLARDSDIRIAATKAAQHKQRGLTQRERHVMELLVTGKTKAEIAVELSCTLSSAEIYRTRVLEKMGADSLLQLMRVAFLADVQISE